MGINNSVIYDVGLRDNMSRGIDGINGRVNALESSINNLGAKLGITLGTAGVVMFTKSMLDAGMQVENARTGLTTLLRDSEGAGQVIKNTMDDAMRTPFAFEGLLSSNKALISAGISADKAREDVLNLANAIAATGGGDDELKRMVVNLQQISNTGKATALDIKQFAYAGVNIYKILGEAGIKVGDDTVITYDMVTSALKKAHEAGGLYYNGLENMAGNTSVQVSNLGDQLFQLKVKMFDDLKPTIEWVIQGLAAFIDKMAAAWEWAKRNQVILKTLATAFTAAFVAVKAWAALSAILLAVENALVAAAVSGASFTTVMTTALGPVGLLTVALSGLAYAYYAADEAQKQYEASKKEGLAKLKADKIADLQSEIAREKNNGLSEAAAMTKVLTNENKALTYQILDVDSKMNKLKSTLREVNAENDKVIYSSSLSKKKAALDAEMSELALRREGLYAMKTGVSEFGKNASNKIKPPTKTAVAEAKMPKTNATGHKAVTINVKIDKLGETHINTTNIKEGMQELKKMVTAVLTGAVNDFQVVASNT